MTFEEVLEQAIAMLQRRGRLTYRTLPLQFQLDEAHLEALKGELIYVATAGQPLRPSPQQPLRRDGLCRRSSPGTE